MLTRLQRLQAERGGNEPTRRGVGLAIATFPNRDHLAIVGELEHWSTAGRGQAKPVKDWVGTLRTFLSQAVAGAPIRGGQTADEALRRRDARLAALNAERKG
ncbi:MAG: hypothetical protein WAU42_11910 [Solirubrobacteraceae bacterium]